MLLLLLAGFYLSWTAGRIDQLHHRIEVARAALDAQLVRRSAVSMELGTCGLLDPAAADAHHGRRPGGPGRADDARAQAESDLSARCARRWTSPASSPSCRPKPAGRSCSMNSTPPRTEW